MDPPGQASFGPEQPMRLPDCYWVYRPLPEAPPVQPPPVLRNGQVTFGSFNAFNKVNEDLLKLWARVLDRTPSSRLLIIVSAGNRGRERIGKLLARCGITQQQVRRAPPLELAGYLERYGEIDVSLDSHPYNAGVTSLDALWMGVPIVTLAGHRPVSRAGATILSNIPRGSLGMT